MSIKMLLRSMLKTACVAVYRFMNIVIPVKKNRIVIASSLGKSYSGNPKALYETIMLHGLDKVYECIWFYEKNRFDIPGNNIQVKYGRFRYLYYMATASFWIFDSRCPMFIRKRKKVSYLQTWHGTPLKKLALDMDNVYMAGEKSIEEYKDNFKKNVSSWDYLISQNPFSTEVFKRAFCYKGEMLETGYPRNDVLFVKNNSEDIAELKRKFNIPDNKRVMLYAPTWRDDEASGIGRYHFSGALDMDKMYAQFGKDSVMIIKYHYLVEDNTDWSVYGDFVRVFDQSVDISYLYLISDILITDYSSVMFDYSILGRPMYFYCYDIEKYKNILRGFYFDFENMSPGPVSKTTEELISDIEGERFREYEEQYCEFVKRYNPWDCKDSSAKVLKKVLGLGEDIVKI